MQPHLLNKGLHAKNYVEKRGRKGRMLKMIFLGGIASGRRAGRGQQLLLHLSSSNSILHANCQPSARASGLTDTQTYPILPRSSKE